LIPNGPFASYRLPRSPPSGRSGAKCSQRTLSLRSRKQTSEDRKKDFETIVVVWLIVLTLGLLFLGLNIGLHLAGNPPYLLSYPVEMTPAMIYVQEHIPQDSVVMGRVQDFYVLKDFRNYVTYRDGTQYGAHLRGESMLDFWQSLQPEVILLRPSQIEADPELQFFITQNRFIQVLPDLWVLPALAKDISP